MRVVLGLSLTANSAVWVLVDTYDGRCYACVSFKLWLYGEKSIYPSGEYCVVAG